MPNPDLPDWFKKRMAKYEEAVRAEPFFILVWGSGQSNDPAFQKRRKVVEHLAVEFGADNVRMSEEVAFQQQVERIGLGSAEEIQVLSSDAVVVLNTSVGPHTEVARYGDLMIGKAIIFVPEEYRNSPSIASTIYDGIKTEGFSDIEFESCTEIRRKAMNFCQALRRKRRTGGILKNALS